MGVTKDMNKSVGSENKKSGRERSNSRNSLKEGAQSVYRTLSLMRTVAEHSDQGVRLSKISQKVGLPITTVHRILSVLVSEEFVSYDPISKLYRLGFEFHNLGDKAKQFSIRDKYQSCMENIAKESEDSVFLIMRSGVDALCINYIQGNYPIRVVTTKIGTRRPLGIGSGSLAILSFSQDKEIESILKANKNRYKRYNNMTIGKLKNLVKRSRKYGYVNIEGMLLEKVSGLGVPIYDQQGKVNLAISVAAMSDRMDHYRADKISKVIQSQISKVVPQPESLIK
jgi:DNA-binding IclR family transcriptional regulator